MLTWRKTVPLQCTHPSRYIHRRDYVVPCHQESPLSMQSMPDRSTYLKTTIYHCTHKPCTSPSHPHGRILQRLTRKLDLGFLLEQFWWSTNYIIGPLKNAMTPMGTIDGSTTLQSGIDRLCHMRDTSNLIQTSLSA
jgi:hypothetical protein